MKISISKKKIDTMERCYALTCLPTVTGPKYIVASEAVGGMCKSYSGENYQQQETLWQQIGGTMSIVPLSNEDSPYEECLISQRYYPGFQAKGSKIVKMTKKGKQWETTDVIEMPYLHRFELLEVAGQTYLVCATLCTWKVSREDWSSPGHIFVGRYNRETNQVTDFRLVLPNLTQNHGLSKIKVEGQERLLISAQEGVFELSIQDERYYCEKKYSIASSESLLLDINNDGQTELLTIEPFHGDTIGIYSQQGALLQKRTSDTQFLHALWGGKVLTKHVYLCGGRRGAGNLVLGYINNHQEIEEVMIDSGNGSANIIVEQTANQLKVISANNTTNEIAEYQLHFTDE